uniref:Uncharacterized protein n=1 Tax=Plectus sambesii TaxID=2011161 RepID=A0A914XDY4_9BILA
MIKNSRSLRGERASFDCSTTWHFRTNCLHGYRLVTYPSKLSDRPSPPALLFPPLYRAVRYEVRGRLLDYGAESDPVRLGIVPDYGTAPPYLPTATVPSPA